MDQGHHHPELRHLPLPTASQRLDALATIAAVQEHPRKINGFFQPTGLHEHDSLSQGIQAVSQGLPATVWPLLQAPFARDAVNTVDPSRGAFELGPTLPPIRSWPHRGYEPNPPLQDRPKPPALARPASASTPASKPDNLVMAGPPEPNFQTSFQFVVNEDAKSARKTIRKHVMKEYRRKERWQKGAVPSGPKANSKPKQHRTPSLSPTSSNSPQTSSTIAPIITGPRIVEVNDDGAPLEEERPSKRRRLPDASTSSHSPTTSCSVDSETLVGEATDDEHAPYSLDPWAAVAKTRLDPFSRLESDSEPACQAILHHFARVMPSIMDEQVAGTVFHRLGWVYSTIAVHDPSPVHVILGYTLAHMARCHKKEIPSLAFEHKQQALQLINTRMQDPVLAISNGAIGGVASFAALELAGGNAQRFVVHMTGIQRMVTGRGGLEALRESSDLEELILRLDVLRAYLVISAPRYPHYACLRSLPPFVVRLPRQVEAPCIDTSIAADSTADLIESPYRSSEDVLLLIHDLEDFMVLIRCAEATCSSFEQESKSLRDLFSLSIGQMLQRPAGRISSHASHLTLTCLRLAALVFLDVAVCEIFDQPQSSGHFARNIKRHFLTSTRPWARSIEMLIAVLLQTDRMKLEKAWRAWYVADAATLPMGLTMLQCLDIEAALVKYLEGRVAEREKSEARSSMVLNLGSILASVLEAWRWEEPREI